MRNVLLILVAVGLGVAGASVSQATSGRPASGVDLALTGYVAGGVNRAESSHSVVFVFTLTNRGPGPLDSSADTVVEAIDNASPTDWLCVFSNGNAFNPDTPTCEFGQLSVGQNGSTVLVLTPSGPGVTVSVRACATNESGIRDPNPANNCKTLTVEIE